MPLTVAAGHLQAATFLEGIVFLIICFTGMRSRLIKVFPRTVLMAGACGIGMFIAFVGVKVNARCAIARRCMRPPFTSSLLCCPCIDCICVDVTHAPGVLQDMGIIVSAPYPTLLKLASSVPYAPGG